jgi:hypothetical protein
MEQEEGEGMRRPKRISRRELKAKTRELEDNVERLQGELVAANFEHKSWQSRFDSLFDRFTRLSTQMNSLQVNGAIQEIEVKPIPFGQYAVLADEFRLSKIPDEIKHQIVDDMVSQLLEGGYIKILIGNDNCFGVTVGAKMYVVPWEQMARGPVIKMQVRMGKQDEMQN